MSDIKEEMKKQYKRAEENDLKAKMKPLFPDDVEMICISKDDYDRLYGDLTCENIELKDYITNLQEENKKLKELCDKYEEEHKTTFEEWKKDIKRIDKIKKYIKETRESDSFTILPSGKITDIEYCLDALEDIEDLLNGKELKGDNK